jgi:hypothetical protein
MAGENFLKIPARDFVLEIDRNYGASGGASFISIEGLTELAMKVNTVKADTTDFDADGVAEHLKMETGREFTVAGHYLEDPLTGERPPGQLFIESYAPKVGTAAYGSYKLTSPGGIVRTFIATVDAEFGGGAHNDAAKWGGTLSISGKVTIVPAGS